MMLSQATSGLMMQIEGGGSIGEVLKRVVFVSKFLEKRGLAFIGQDELGSPHNGNYLVL